MQKNRITFLCSSSKGEDIDFLPSNKHIDALQYSKNPRADQELASKDPGRNPRSPESQGRTA